jgi:hypothetical protein
MSFNFEINRVNSDSIGELWFELNDKKYDFKFQVCTPDCDQFSENLNAHYFTFAMTNKFGAKLIRIEYIDCFSVLASKIDSLGYLRLFNLDINKEFKSNEKNELKKLFLEINDCIVKLYLSFESYNPKKIIYKIIINFTISFYTFAHLKRRLFEMNESL